VHSSPITAITAKTDGHIITGGYDGNVIYWDAESNMIWKTKLPDLVNSVELSPDESRVYVAVADGYAYALYTDSGFTQQRFGPHGDDVNYVTVNPNSRQILTVADAKDGNIYLWNAVTGIPERLMPGHPGGTFSAKFSSAHALYATTGGDGCVRVWKQDNSEAICVIEAGCPIETIRWVGDACTTLLAGHNDGAISLWAVPSGRLLRRKSVASSTIRCLEVDRLGRTLMVGSYDGQLGLFDTETWEMIGSLQAPFQWERSGIFSNDKIYVGSFSAKPIIYDLSDGIISIPRRVPSTRGINCMAEGEKGRIYIAGDDGTIAELTEQDRRIHYQSLTAINAVVILDYSEELVAADYKGSLVKINLANTKELVHREIGAGPVNCLDYDRKRDVLLSGGYDGVVRLWTRNLVEITSYQAFNCPCKTVRAVPSLELILIGGSDGRLAAIHADGRIDYVADQNLEVLNDIAVHYETSRFATASRDCHVRVWDANTLQCLAVLPRVHSKSIKSIAFDQQTGAMVSGSYDGTVVIWKKVSGTWGWKRILENSKPGISIVKTFRDGTVGAAGWNGNFHRWTLEGEQVYVMAAGMSAGK
jgi:WD40 repeat protein